MRHFSLRSASIQLRTSLGKSDVSWPEQLHGVAALGLVRSFRGASQLLGQLRWSRWLFSRLRSFSRGNRSRHSPITWRLKLPMRTPYPSGPKEQQNLWWFLFPPAPNHPKSAISMNFYKWFLKISWNPLKFSSKSVRKTTNLSQKSWKICKFWWTFLKNLMKFRWISMYGAVQKNWHLVDLEKMLKNAPTFAIWGVDTADNEPSKVSMK